MRWQALISSTAFSLTLLGGAAVAGETLSSNAETARSVPAYSVFLNARPAPGSRATSLPQRTAAQRVTSPGQPWMRPGDAGGPVETATQIIPEPLSARSSSAPSVTPKAVGEDIFPFTTSRVELAPAAKKPVIGAYYPYRAVGRLAFKINGVNTWCTATLIDRSLIVTAARCVAKFGSKKNFDNAQWAFIPGYYMGKGAYGVYAAQEAFPSPAWRDGTDTCDKDNPGEICQSDVAVIVLAPAKKKYAGDKAGWLGVTTGGFTGSVQYPDAQVTQLGYPKSIDGGERPVRNDSAAFVGVTAPFNTMIGSPFDEGAAGAPLVVNFGMKPDYASGAEPSGAEPNLIAGVTSWYYDGGGGVAGASPFKAENLGTLITAACAKYSWACKR